MKTRNNRRRFSEKTIKRVSIGAGVLFLILLMSSKETIVEIYTSHIGSIGADTALIYFVPYGKQSIPVGEMITVDISVNSKKAINAVGTTILFPTDLVEIVSISKKDSFLDLWPEDTVIKAETGEVRFSAGTTKKGGQVGTATAMTLTLRAKKAGEAELQFKDTQVFPDDGSGKPLELTIHSLTYTIAETMISSASTTLPISPAGGGAGSGATEHRGPNPDFSGDGKVTLVDVSILSVKIFGSYSAHYDLSGDGKLGLADLSVLFTKMHSE